MIRRPLAAAILGLSLFAASLAWTGFTLLNTALDPQRSEKIADSLYDDPLVRAQLEANIATAVARALPAEVPVTDEQLEAGAAVALDSPAVKEVFRDAFVETHQAFLGEGDPPCCLDLGAVSGEVRSAVVAANPALDGVVPAAPELEVRLPTESIPDVSGPRSWLQTAVPVLALVALAGIALAMLFSKDRPGVVRRAGVWAVFAAATWLIIVFGLPWVARQFLESQAAVMTALVEAVAGAMIVPSIVLAGTGVALVVGASLWPRLRRSGVISPPVATGDRGPVRAAGRTGMARMAPARSGTPPAPSHGTGSPAPRARPDADRTSVLADPTQVAGRPTPTPSGAGDPSASRPRTRWVDGVGYVVEPGETPPVEATWRPGVGWVLPGGPD